MYPAQLVPAEPAGNACEERPQDRPRALLDGNDSYRLFQTLDYLIVTGPTRTNINDFRAILVN